MSCRRGGSGEGRSSCKPGSQSKGKPTRASNNRAEWPRRKMKTWLRLGRRTFTGAVVDPYRHHEGRCRFGTEDLSFEIEFKEQPGAERRVIIEGEVLTISGDVYYSLEAGEFEFKLCDADSASTDRERPLTATPSSVILGAANLVVWKSEKKVLLLVNERSSAAISARFALEHIPPWRADDILKKLDFVDLLSGFTAEELAKVQEQKLDEVGIKLCWFTEERQSFLLSGLCAAASEARTGGPYYYLPGGRVNLLDDDFDTTTGSCTFKTWYDAARIELEQQIPIRGKYTEIARDVLQREASSGVQIRCPVLCLEYTGSEDLPSRKEGGWWASEVLSHHWVSISELKDGIETLDGPFYSLRQRYGHNLREVLERLEESV